ncbi:MAG: DUF4956 domain-containing protein [Planctomycetes bacterium]|nr:DUF4956 domain-containing protein [Planctomycetota bacterium]
MPDWVKNALGAGTMLPFHIAALRLAVAVLAGLAVAWVYRLYRRRPGAGVEAFSTALILLCVLVAMTAMVIGDNVARAFSLVGALAIVRFRTEVEDTSDTAFVVFAVVAGMAAGVGNFVLCAAGVPLVAMVALARSAASHVDPSGAPGGAEQPLLVRIGAGDDARASVESFFKSHLSGHRLVRTATARQGAALELTWNVRLREGGDAVALVREINSVKGVQHVELGEA